MTRTPLPDPGTAPLFTAGLTVRQHTTAAGPDRDELQSELAVASAVILTPEEHIDAALLERARNLKVLAVLGADSGNIDMSAARRRGVVVTNTAGIAVEATADLCWTLLFAAARGVVAADRFVRAGRVRRPSLTSFLGAKISGATLGVIGMGKLGTAVVRRASGFAMNVLFTSRRSKGRLAAELGAQQVTVAEALQRSDFLVLTSKLTPETRHLLNADALRLMKPSSVLVNVAGGALVDEVALVEALRTGQIGAAGLDTYENEFVLTPGLADLDNVVLTPYAGPATVDTRKAEMRKCCDNVIDVLCGSGAVSRG